MFFLVKQHGHFMECGRLQAIFIGKIEKCVKPRIKALGEGKA